MIYIKKHEDKMTRAMLYKLRHNPDIKDYCGQTALEYFIKYCRHSNFGAFPKCMIKASDKMLVLNNGNTYAKIAATYKHAHVLPKKYFIMSFHRGNDGFDTVDMLLWTLLKDTFLGQNISWEHFEYVLTKEEYREIMMDDSEENPIEEYRDVVPNARRENLIEEFYERMDEEPSKWNRREI